jgi:tellurite methyltransferase
MAESANAGGGGPGPRSRDYAFAGDWAGYVRSVRGEAPRPTLVRALERFDAEPVPDAPRSAVDLAAGEGRDTRELLRRGWRVLAIEREPTGLDALIEQTPAEYRDRLQTARADFASAEWPAGVDLFNCSFSLPFCPEDLFPVLFDRIAASIRPGGRFSGQLFGDRDTWARCGRTLGHSRTRVDRLFEAFTLEDFREDEKDEVDPPVPSASASEAVGRTPGPKHWHVFHIVARRR